MANFLSWIYVGAAVILLFGAAIFVHEYGHFWMARRRGLKVEGFSIGFGPKILGWTRDGIDYAWRWIPAGGFVKLPQMITAEAIEGKGEDQEKLPPISPLSKILVAVAGPAMNIVFGCVIATVLYFTGIPVPIDPAIIGHVPVDSPEYELGIRDGARVLAVDGRPATSWEAVQEIVVLARTNRLPVMVECDGKTNTYLLGTTIDAAAGLKTLNLEPLEHPVVKRTLLNSAAQMAGVQTGDKIISFAQVPISSRQQLIKLVEDRPNKTTDLAVERSNSTSRLSVIPKPNPATGKGFLGIEFSPELHLYFELRYPGPPPWVQVGDVVDKMVSVVGALIHTKQTGVGPSDLSGPVGIATMIAFYVKNDWRLALSFLVLLNINLAALNLLPIPVLDGGHVLMALVEKIWRRPLSLKFIEITTTAFAVLLISFMLYVSYFDIKRIPLLRSMFSGEVQVEKVGHPTPVPEPAR